MRNTTRKDPGDSFPDHGIPCWVDLATPDPTESASFYHELFGWKYVDHRGRTIALRADLPVAMISPLSDEWSAIPSYWHVYLSSAPFDMVAQRPGAAGGKLLRGPVTIDDLARVVTAQDPGGATVSLWEPNVLSGFRADRPGTPAWFEIHVPSPLGIADFYADLFDLTAAAVDTVSGAYRLLVRWDGTPVAGVRSMADAPRWVTFFGTDHLDETGRRAEDLGATIVGSPTSLEPLCRTALFRDPVGAEFGLVEPTAARRAGSAADGHDDNAGYPTTLTL